MTADATRGSELGIRDAGDSALLLELAAVIDPAVNRRAIAIAQAVSRARLAGVRDVVPTYRSVAVHFDPLLTDVEQLRVRLRQLAEAAPASEEGRLVEVSVSYGGENGPDLQDVASFAGVAPEVVIERHCATQYRVFMLGFLPGFAYMGSVDDTIAAPRRATPRTRIPAGSVGIAGRQTGIYPLSSPGGWQLIGRTSVRVFDPERPEPSLFAPGDQVRFVAVAESGAESHEPKVPRPESRAAGAESRSITVVKPGLFTTVQDGGRWGHQDRGVPVSGPMDRVACRLANLLVGNMADEAVLEATILGPELRFEQPAIVAVTGADLSAFVDGTTLALNTTRACAAGSVLRFGERRSGARAYIACDGGFDVPSRLGSRATHVLSGLGGFEGRALKAGDRLALGDPREGASISRIRSIASDASGATLRVMRGPQDDYFDEAAFDALQEIRFVVSPQSDRMGYRLIGSERTRLTLQGKARPFGPGTSSGAMISDATFMGGLQIPPSGDPILLMADRQTTGGYPQIATVISADLPLAGQLAPGDTIQFRLCTRGEARAALIAQEAQLRAV